MVAHRSILDRSLLRRIHDRRHTREICCEAMLTMNQTQSGTPNNRLSDTPATSTPAVADSSESTVTQEMERDDDSLYRSHPFAWWLTLIAPIVVSLMLLVVLYFAAGPAYTRRLLSSLVAGLFLFGRFIILGGHDRQVAEVTGGMTSGELFLMVTYMDVFVAVVLVYHSAFLFRLPWFGSRATALIEDGRFFVTSQPWVRRTTFLGVVSFVAFPLAAMGSVGGTIFGRLLGMTRLTTFLAVLIGSLVGNGTMWWASELINKYVDKQHPVVRYGGVVLILLLVAGIESAYRRAKRRSALAATNDHRS